ncbi:MAG: hypothetical protein ACJAVS_000510 [Paracoccaceae bacterium]|jgi:hypothetical protein
MGRALLEALGTCDARLTPERIAQNTESDYRRKLFYGDAAACKAAWTGVAEGEAVPEWHRGEFLWKRRRVIHSDGFFRHAHHDNKEGLLQAALSFDAERRADVDWLGLFRTWQRVMRAPVGMLHIRTQ